MAAHSSVNYVEPNYISNDENGIPWKVKDDYERTPRIEDYSIMINLEVEICGRENISQSKKSSSEVLVLSFTTKKGGGTSTVNFLGGTKMSTGKGNYDTVPYLTTNYADMYVNDLYDYGTTELIGIKSVDIEYQKGCVPIVNIVFTDVRGLSLMQPTELSRVNEYHGIGGINADNVAQSFFQCFFKLPMPRFTMTIKGFYGKPVTYEVLCDKFDTKFNSASGDYEVNTRFIGYSYSFLTDISIDALVSAPYSDYPGGKDYWESEKANGRFVIWNKERTEQKPMPTLVEIFQEMKTLSTASTTANTSLSVEEDTHEKEIAVLQEILDKSRRWYDTLFNICCTKYGKDYCYLFKEEGTNGDPYRIVILTNSSTSENKDMSESYKEFPDTFKRENQNLHSAIETYNQNIGNFKIPVNVSIDFTQYHRVSLFNNCFVNHKGEVIFNGFSSECKLPKTQVTNHIFYGKEIKRNEWDTEEDFNNKRNENKRSVLSLIYGNGVDQYVDCYDINVDFRSVKNRIAALQADADKDMDEKEHEARLTELNNRMFNSMCWYPTVENFTRIMVAHLETLMNMMYNVVNECAGRKAEDLGITCGPDGNASDVRASASVVPPFPKVTRHINESDGVNKFEDCWIGDFNGKIPFAEVSFIDGMFNAAEKLADIYKNIETVENERSKDIPQQEEVKELIINHPLSSFDFFITESPYGDSNEMFNDINGYEFAARVGLRMYNIIGNNNITREFAYFGGDQITHMGEVEAENFLSLVRIENPKFLDKLRQNLFNSDSSDNILKTLTNVIEDESCPWGNNKPLFEEHTGGIAPKYFNVGKNNLTYFYPIQGYTISGAKEYSNALKDNVIGNYNGSMFLSEIPISAINGKTIPNDKSGFGNTIIYDDYKFLQNYIEKSNSCDGYEEIYNLLLEIVEFKDDAYNSFINVAGTPSIVNRIDDLSEMTGNTYFKLEDGKVTIIDEKREIDEKTYSLDINGFTESGFVNFTILEMFSVRNKSSNSPIKVLDENSSIVAENMAEINYDAAWDKDENGEYKREDCKLIREADGYKLNDNELRLTKMLLGIKTNMTYIKQNIKTITYMPRLVALQIGALIFQSGGVKYTANSLNKRVPLQSDIDVIPDSDGSKMTYMKYYLKWINENTKYVKIANDITERDKVDIHRDINKDILTFSKYYHSKYGGYNNDGDKRMILHQGNYLVTEFSNVLLSPVCVVNTSYVRNTNFYVKKGHCELFLNAFFERLKAHFGMGYEKDENGNLIKVTEEPKKTSTDMKIELYKYMKQIYDKWIPMSSFDDWKLGSFFMEGSGSEKNGHKFHFIDSFYNDISHKLLINPQTLSDRIEALLSYRDVNATMLGFMSDIYSSNKCMLMSIQNFADLREPGCMNEMFTPLSFNSIDWPKLNKYPSFVVVYPYSPSRNLDVANGEYANDSFMLNDEFETPSAVRSKTGDQIKIPAFGVSYGRQYQSYFKSININMQSPIETEQSIKAKHYIIRQQTTDKDKGIVAQDLYDIYSSRSYTCEVEMMGCAWIQPMMYFVLLNVPMFRGSYMIMSVKHSIKPGDMTTRFTGCRMANSSTKMVENIFTDENFDGGSSSGRYGSSYEIMRQEKANIDNDCPYKVYPLFSADTFNLVDIIKKSEGEYVGNRDGKICTMRGVTLEKYQELINPKGTCTDLRNISDDDWYVVFKTFWNKWQADSIETKCIANLLVDWYWTSGKWGIYFPQDVIFRLKNGPDQVIGEGNPNRGDTEAAISETVSVINSYENKKGLFEALKSRRKRHFESLAEENKNGYEAASLNGWLKRLNRFDYFDDETDEQYKDDVNYALFKCLKLTCANTPSMDGISIEFGYTVNKERAIINPKRGAEKLHLVFDALLNSDYVNYIEILEWHGRNGSSISPDIPPFQIRYVAKLDVDPSVRRVYFYERNLLNYDNKITYNSLPEIKILPILLPKDGKTDECNHLFLKSLSKRLATIGNVDAFKKEAQQIQDTTRMAAFIPQSCDSLFGDGIGVENYEYDESSVPSDVKDYYIDGWNVGAACDCIIKTSSEKSRSICATSVLIAVSVGSFHGENCKLPGSANGQNRIHCGGDGQATRLWYNNVLKDNGFKLVNTGKIGNFGKPDFKVQPGDIAIIGESTLEPSYHAVMFTGSNGWVSDFRQNGMTPYSKVLPYAIFRYGSGKFTTKQQS